MYFGQTTNPDVAAATAELHNLTQEQTELPGKLRAASNMADAEAIIELTDRRDKLPAFIFAAQVKVCKTKLAVLQAEKREAQAKHSAASDEMAKNVQLVTNQINEMERAVRDLYSKRDSYQLAEMSSYANVKDVLIKIERAENELRLLISKQVNDTPVVSDVVPAIGHRVVSEALSSAVTPATGHRQSAIPGSLYVPYDGD